MGILDKIRGARRAAKPDDGAFNGQVARILQAYGEFMGLDDPVLAEFMRTGTITTAGISVSEEKAMQNPAVFRSVNLISRTIGMLPFHMIDKDTKEKANEHSLFMLLHRQPNAYQTACEFRTLMQSRVLTKGNAYARIVRGGSTGKIMSLIPLNPDWVTPKLDSFFQPYFEYRPNNGGMQTFKAKDILHLRGYTRDGFKGIALLTVAANAIGVALAAELAAARWLKNGTIVSGWLETEQKLGETAIKRLKADLVDGFAGADKSGGTPVLEQGLSYKTPTLSFRDAQYNELRGRQVEEIARVFDVPRPLLMVDDTSWGSGIEVLGEHFVRYGLNFWFEMWQQACERALFTDAERAKYELKFNAGALTRGSLKDQGDYFAKASGAGGHKPWMSANEIRAILDMPAHADGDGLEPAGAGDVKADNPLAVAGHNNPPPD